ncbi:nascent polypeptide-associated complex subunit alpha, muscle-specific form isoform X2 [Diachasma alloeum]|uniref:nascent polypeptide-associated complex subunit alpha, muscle-specific form isoform X2 n=1 Tax=Diachasma alloeum TaxID=454923 RepID=UPI000738499D|nr:nascent polypeptide-associated complex subunit alpha, muscle-specific form isoform X2 [Diachasma alloeum]
MKGGPPPWAGFTGAGASPWAAYGPPLPWAANAPPYAPFGVGKSAYARSLGPAVAPGMSTITVPYVPKASPFFPKFVDPQAMIAKKTDMLANLFGGLGPVKYPIGEVPLAPVGPSPAVAFGPAKPFLYATNDAASSKDPSDPQEILGEDKTTNEVKRGVFGPKFGPPGAAFSPFASKFGPVPPKFGPFGPFSGFNAVGSSDADFTEDSSSRRKRAIVGVAPETPKNLGPPPPYPGLSSIPEEPETDASGVPKQYLPGIFGPFGPFGPGPLVDPSIYMTKKTAFLSTLFSNLATSTPAPPGTVPDPTAPKSTIVPPSFWLPFAVPTESAPAPEVTDMPVPKSTIVPADFWLPSSVIPGPTEYTDKVSQFLDKLFESLKLNKTLSSSSGTTDDSTMPKTVVARSVDELQTAKDAIVDSIMGELGSIKTDMLSTLDDMIVAQKAAAAAAPFAKATKPGKAGKPLSPWAALFAPPTVDPMLPFKQKMMMLSQLFDMLTGMQKNITQAIEETVKSASVTEAPAAAPAPFSSGAVMTFNTTLLDAIKAKLDSLDKAPVAPVVYPYPGLWGAYPGGYSPSSAAKRNVEDEDYYDKDREDGSKHEKRGVKMAMHQGYQSMPPGAIETVQAGGGSVPGHQGGGIKLFESQQNDYEDWGKQWATEWAESLKSQNDGHRHHHNHH